ncbi:ABC transporter ATP-binding protein [Candidatus Symbiobacter mobilis]|uniref:Branched-chain amino acid transporter ATP-binding protein n=1 Tax=Candidatus Symbiobacter mobilis CR TaxID=946483 RepID=U5NA20_9BURK|nr:ABC transporter ATP-binding protein [Candidatus Symbiobacter mobilis]AGX88252.1 branched-chain amino acid transporter ATP-binding protein [Candidatus Symbiobacter mobilis CR]
MPPSLRITNLHAGYPDLPVLRGVCLDIAPGETVALLGRNGSGRSTLAKAIMGLVAARGCIAWQGRNLVGLAPFEIARAGVGYVSESRDVFPALTVEENLLLGARHGATWALEDIYRRFPALRERRHVRGGLLSGGEQQMLALGRALLRDPALLLLDEPTEGLSPPMVDAVRALLTTLRERRTAVLLIEQKLALCLDSAQRGYVLDRGEIIASGAPATLAAYVAARATIQDWPADRGHGVPP